METEGLKLRGFYRVKLGEEDPKTGKTKVIGDSGWHKNEVMNLGFQNYICNLVGALAGSKQVGMAVIGTGTTPNVTATALPGETKRFTCGNAVVASKTMQATVSIPSASHPGGTPTIQNIALIENTASGGSIMVGNTYATSVWNTNQGLSATYQLRFGTA